MSEKIISNVHQGIGNRVGRFGFRSHLYHLFPDLQKLFNLPEVRFLIYKTVIMNSFGKGSASVSTVKGTGDREADVKGTVLVVM